MKLLYTIALVFITAHLLKAQTVDIDIYNNTGYDVRLEPEYLPGALPAGPRVIKYTPPEQKKGFYPDLALENQDLDQIVTYKMYYEDAVYPLMTVVNANELDQRAAQVGANKLLMTLEADPGYILTGIKVRITARGKTQPQQGATQPIEEETELGEFEPIPR